ncbi:FAD/NAD(P)-binding protein [Leucobacter allii]|uniref:FAD/NAD(P)-binding protein n=1 Tax=Leucobacter allii TaxID=2932247 RepID=UPI001FD47680|nr:FAD/NAD(P)-binding protein [Leucobacter allii]UOR01285.1 FAD/NAD(P)-binding protein [Leucobacter allii]
MSGEGAAATEVRIVCVGAGPAAVMILERILANHARDFASLALDIRLVDPYEPGGGRIWRREQSPLLKLNTLLRDDTVFTDASCRIEGPVAPGPSLAEWIAEVIAGRIPRPDWWDARLEAEIREARDDAFPTRRLNNAYLSWAYGEIVRRAAPGATVAWHEDRVTAVEDLGDPGPGAVPERGSPGAGYARASRYRVRLASGAALAADIVVHAIGHNGSEPSGPSVALGDFARRHGLRYVPPAFTADVPLDWVPAGEDVIVRGMGLAAVDLVVLLTEGRGGRYERAGDRLVYRPSGREPVLHLGSRRGVPYRSKITSALAGDPVRLEYVGPAFREAAARSGEPLDFERDVWPLLASEMVTGYYRELGTGHPEALRGSWDDFAARLRETLAEPEGYRSAALRALVAERVPDPLDRFDLDAFDRPLAEPEAGDGAGAGMGAGFGAGAGDGTAAAVGGTAADAGAGADAGAAADADADAEALQRRVRAHIARDLELRTSQRRSATQGLFMTVLFAYLSIAEVPPERWNARSRTRLLPRRWLPYFSYLASGPPGHRLEELLALSEAGLLRFLGGELELETDEAAGEFAARGSARVAGRTVRAAARARILIDAWLPEATAATSDNPLLRQLIASGQAQELAVADAQHAGSTGQLAVTADGRLPGVGRQFAMGPFTATPTGGAFTRPGLDSLPFRLNDRLARALLADAAELASARAAERSPAGLA